MANRELDPFKKSEWAGLSEHKLIHVPVRNRRLPPLLMALLSISAFFGSVAALPDELTLITGTIVLLTFATGALMLVQFIIAGIDYVPSAFDYKAEFQAPALLKKQAAQARKLNEESIEALRPLWSRMNEVLAHNQEESPEVIAALLAPYRDEFSLQCAFLEAHETEIARAAKESEALRKKEEAAVNAERIRALREDEHDIVLQLARAARESTPNLKGIS